MGRPREHDEQVGEALLDAAEELLASGPDAISVRAVADAVGTTTRAVYSLFGSKEGLVQHVAARGYRLLATNVNAVRVGRDPAADLVAAGVHGFRPFAVGRPHLFRLTFERIPAELHGAPGVTEAALASYESLAIRVRRAQEARVIDDRPVVEVAFVFHSLCLGLANGELSQKPPPIGASRWQAFERFDGARVWQSALEALVRGLAPRRR